MICAEMTDESLGSQPPEGEHAQDSDPADHCAELASDEVHETEHQKRVRLEAAVRKYRATLRNEAEADNGGFSADYYRSQKPPHW